MIASWCSTGRSPRDFWRFTPREVQQVIEGHQRARAWDAWHIGLVALGRVESMDDLLPAHLRPPPPDRTAAVAHGLAMVRARFGIKSEFIPYEQKG